ncbi:MAG TPA: SH3 domain-containing protein [Candidatus Avacidaminococcus intestinavium]|uniref:SH3 domain-containing protein n=1 Tax=Candidatus Avacidaminococcus intestinavium TaxID=2840684 RepID=A0A9D1MNR3_9FIRM|nr:SH3 domain-containing protein [Candidatus Avacidaminococcus intestinavium]
MVGRFLAACLILTFLFTGGAYSEAAGITHYEKFITPVYWQSQNSAGDEVVMNEQQIASFNQAIIRSSSSVYNLLSYPAVVSGKTVVANLNEHMDLTNDLYRNGTLISDNYKNILLKELNVAAVPEQIHVRYGVTVGRANLRNLPTGEGLFTSSNDQKFDVLQETALDPGEAVVILHKSANGYFYYVQSYNYRGWLTRLEIAETDRITWLRYVNPKNFLTVLDNSYQLVAGGKRLFFQQGARLQFSAKTAKDYIVLAPMRTLDGQLQEMKVNVVNTKSLHEGYLPYTTNNLLASAFKFYGDVYGWGGLNQSVDCSSFVNNVYRTVGVFLPRNADEQEYSAGRKVSFEGLSSEQRNAVIKGLTPGSTLHMDGHVMLYIGSVNGVLYGIHSLGSHYTGGSRQVVMRVVVSDLELQKANGMTFLDALTTTVTFRE